MSELVLLGAGASYGSARSGRRPPLGRDLFAELCRFSPLWHALPTAAAAEFTRGGLFEPGFAWIRKHCDDRSIGLLRHMAFYFLEIRPTADNLYLQFANGARRRNSVQLATLNYDLLLEACLIRQLGGFTYGRSGAGSLGLLKVHGSPNLVPETMGAQIRDLTFSGMGGSAYESNAYTWLPPDDAKLWLHGQESLAPAMALYEAGKYVPIGGNAVKAIQGHFRAACTEASRIYIAGTSYQAHDAHVWDPIVQSKAKIVVADPSPGSFSPLEARVGSRLTIAPLDFGRFAQAYEDRSI